MATGDDATNAGMPLVPGTGQAKDLDTYDNETRDYVAQGPQRWKPGVQAVAIVQGGTGATTAAAARTALGIIMQAPDSAPATGAGGTLPVYNATGQLTSQAPTLAGHVATKAYVDSHAGGGSSAADGPTSAAYNRSATGSGWFQTWMNNGLQFMRNTSARRYKKNIRPWSGSVLDLEPVIFDRRGADTPNDEVGFIAEQVLESLPEAVVFFDGKVDGIADRAILAALVADVQRLNARLSPEQP